MASPPTLHLACAVEERAGSHTKMGYSFEEDYHVLLEIPSKRNDITRTYKRQRWRSKIATGSSRNANDQELENHSENVGNHERNKDKIPSLANVNGDGNAKMDIDVKLLGVPAPNTPDIASRKHERRTKPKRRSLNLDTRNVKGNGPNDLRSVETDANIGRKSVSKASVPLSQVQEYVSTMTEVGEFKVFGSPRALLVYSRRKRVKIHTKKEKTSSSSLPNELKGPNISVKKKLARPDIDDIFTKKPENEEQKERQNNVKESLYRQIHLFLSRMSHIQGGRKFSQWKGSVVDSIVGAYLAQNVGDVLSSSAFMLLAAKYPREAVSPVETSSARTRNGRVTKGNAACNNNVQKGEAAKKDGYSKIQNIRKQRTKKEHDAELVDILKDYQTKYYRDKKEIPETSDSVDWESVRMAKDGHISEAIKIRGMNNNLAKRIKRCLDCLVETFGSTDMEWLADVSPHITKKYLINMYGLGLKTVECIRLLTLRQKAFPIDTNAGRVAVRLGWVPIKQLPEGEEFHRIKKYPKLNRTQMYLWRHLSPLDWLILYELHCQMITFGKGFCTEKNPGCRECPMKDECKYFTSSRASCELEGRDIEDYGRIKLGNRTKHQVYILPDGHYLLPKLESRELIDPCPYLLAVWAPDSLEKDEFVSEEHAVYGTLLIPVRTATRGMFPLNGTFFQANEVFADDESSEVPLEVPRARLTDLSTTALYCGTNMSQICKGMTSVEVQECFNRGFTCFRGFNRKTREPKPLPARFHKAGSNNKKR